MQDSETKFNPMPVDGDGECRISKEEFYGFVVDLAVDSENRGVALDPDWLQTLGSPLKAGCVSEIGRGQEIPIDLLARSSRGRDKNEAGQEVVGSFASILLWIRIVGREIRLR